MQLFYIEESQFSPTVAFDLKMNLDLLCDDDMKALAKYIVNKHKFKDVFSICKKADRLAEYVSIYATPDEECEYMIIDDVLKSGETLTRARIEFAQNLSIGVGEFFGVVVFSKLNPPPEWVIPIFQM